MNQIVAIGFLTNDPRPGRNSEQLSFVIAIPRNPEVPGGDADFIPVVWDHPTLELHRGDKVAVTGGLHSRNYMKPLARVVVAALQRLNMSAELQTTLSRMMPTNALVRIPVIEITATSVDMYESSSDRKTARQARGTAAEVGELQPEPTPEPEEALATVNVL